MGRTLVSVAMILCSLPAVAANTPRTEFSTATMCAALQPCVAPAEYSSGAFLDKPIIKLVTMRQIQVICGSGGEHASSGDGVMGCAQLTGTACIVHLPSELKAQIPELYRLVLTHELAHCRGWVHG